MEEKVLSLAKELGDAGHDFLIVIAKDGKVVNSVRTYNDKKNVEAIVRLIGNEITGLFNIIFPF